MMLRYALLIVSLLLVFVFGGDLLQAQTTDPTHPGRWQMGAQGVTFTPNRGQVVDTRGERRPDVLYTADANGARVFVRSNAISYVFDRYVRKDDQQHGTEEINGPDHDETMISLAEQYRMDVELIGARERVEVVENDQAEGARHYYLAHCPDGILDVPSFRHLTLKNVYPKIDMVLRGTAGGMKVDFVVHPGGRIADIRLRYVDASAVRLGEDGSIKATTPLGELVEAAPISLQTVGGTQRAVATHFRLDGDIVTFDVGRFDGTESLVIDPIRRWSTYYGGTGNELLLGGDPTEVDRAGNAIITGYVNGTAFPTTTGAHQTTSGGSDDGFVVKLNGNGALQWATYYGGSGMDLPHGVVSDTSLNVFIAGHTLSNNFPVTTGAFQTTYGGNRDAFVVKFNSAGTRQWASYYGGSALDDGYGFAADSTGSVALLVTTNSSNLQTSGMVARPTNNSVAEPYDIVIAKFSPTGARIWATYFGGNNTDYGYAVGTDTSQSIIISGWTYSTNLPLTNAAQSTIGGSADAYVAKFNKDGARLWSTYYGGGNMENDQTTGLGFVGVATDLSGNVFIGGVVASGGFPTTIGSAQTTYGGGANDGYVVKFNSLGARQWATYFGGSGDDAGTGVAARPDGAVLLTGYTTSTNLPVTTDCIYCGPQGQRDVFITRMNSLGVREYVDYYGGLVNDEGHGISFDPYGSMVVGGVTYSTNFPIQNAAQAFKGGNSTANPDAFVALFCDPSKPMIDSSGPLSFCPGDSVTLSALEGFVSYRWNDAGQSTTHRITVKETGNYVLQVVSASGCAATSDTIKVRVHQRTKPRIFPVGPIRLCLPDSVTLDPGPGYAVYTWLPNMEIGRTLKVKTAGTYRVMTIDNNGCLDTSDPVVVTAFPKPQVPTISPNGPITICQGDPLTLSAAGNSTDSYRWNNGQSGQSLTPTASGTYRVTVTTANGCTETSQDVVVTINPKPLPVIYPQGPTTFCEGDSVLLSSSNGYTTYKWSTGSSSTNITVKTSGTYTLEVTDDKGCKGTTSVQITVLPRPTPRVTVTGPLTFCEGESVTLDAGDGYGSYRWSNGETSRTIEAKLPGQYYVVVSANGANCPGTSDTVTVKVNPAPRAAMSGPIVVCQNTTANYSVPAEPGRTYTWTVSGTSSSIESGAGTEAIVVKWGPAGSGTVRIKIVDNATGCSSDTTVTVTIGDRLVPSIQPSRSTTLCAGDSVTLDAGSGYTSYQWDNGQSGRRITVKAAGTYKVSVANAAGCSGDASITVTIAPAPAPVIASTATAICPGESATLSTTQPFASYLWSTGETTPTIDVRTAGTYTVTVTNAAGCKGPSESFSLTINELPQPAVSGPASVCPNARERYCADGTDADQYEWTVTGGTIVSGAGTRCIEVQWGPNGTGRVDVTMRSAATGCRGAGTPVGVTISSNLQPSITALGSTDLCAGDSVTLEAPDGFTYEWSTGATSRTIRVAAGTYRVTVIGSGGCTGSGEITVTERAPLAPEIIVRGASEFCEGDSVQIDGPQGMTSYRWSTGDTTASIMVSTSGVYTLAVTDDNGCNGRSNQATIRVNPLPAPPTITRDGEDLVSSPGTTYQWFVDGVLVPGATQQRFRPSTTAMHMVRISNEYGCMAYSMPVEGAGATAELAVPELSAMPGEKVSIPITITSARNLDAVGARDFTATMRFNRTLLLPTAETPMGEIVGNDRVVTITGTRTMGVYSGPIATLDFIAALGDTNVTPLTVESFQWLDAPVQTTVTPGLFRIVSEGGWRLYLPGGRLSITKPAPNPTMGRAVIGYEVIEPGETDLALYDVIGRRVRDLAHGDMKPGIYAIEIDTDPLAGGTYYIVLVTPTARIIESMQVAH
jgi:hypothetical protein